jgi:hypothetical protein
MGAGLFFDPLLGTKAFRPVISKQPTAEMLEYIVLDSES